jgi:hypothetical protein
MSLSDTLTLHYEICEAMHQIILMENRCLKSTGTPPDEVSLQAKRIKLAELSASLATIQAQISSRPTAEIRAASAKAQQAILKALLVDRENEKLLLKAIAAPVPPKTTARPPAAHFHRAYPSAS